MIDQALSTLSGLTDLDRTAILQILMGQDDRTLKIKALLGITGDSKDHIIQFVVETVEDMVLSYINQDALPTKLERVLIVMCVSYYKSAGLGNAQAATGPVFSVRRGMCRQALPPLPAPPGQRRHLTWAARRKTFLGGGPR